jgi:hypothetical protein
MTSNVSADTPGTMMTRIVTLLFSTLAVSMLGLAAAHGQVKSAQPASQPGGAALPTGAPASGVAATKAAPVGGTAAASQADAPDQLKYDAHMASAKAYADANAKTQAIDAYEKAMLAAPDPAARAAARAGVSSITGWMDNDWLGPAIKVVQSVWLWVIVFFLLLIGRELLRRGLSLPGARRSRRIRINYSGDGDFASYFRELVRLEMRSIEELLALVRQIKARSSGTVYPSFESVQLALGLRFIAELRLSLPKAIAEKWWSPVVTSIVDIFDAPDYTIDICAAHAGGTYGVSSRIHYRKIVLAHWHRSCAEDELPDTAQDVAFAAVCIIREHAR